MINVWRADEWPGVIVDEGRAMRLPEGFLLADPVPEQFQAAYQPLGFCPVFRWQFGDGDTFGLYWPVGLEDREPIVAECWHDEASLHPRYSSLDRFLNARLEPLDPEAPVDEERRQPARNVSLEEDPRSPTACLNGAREALRAQNVSQAVSLLEIAVEVLPEYTAAQMLLSAQYRRIGRHDDAVRSAIQALISPPCLGSPPTQLASWLSRLSAGPDDVQEDPIWKNRSRLTWKFGGVKHNDNYDVMLAAIQEYLNASAFVPAMTLMQTYQELMRRETISFQERYGFEVEKFREWQQDVAANQYGRSRVLILPPA